MSGVRCEIGAGLNQFVDDLEKYKDHAMGYSKRSIYEGAKILADELRSGIAHLETMQKGVHHSGRRVAYDYEVEGLLEGLGITPMKQSLQIVDAKIGMDGYNHHPTKSWPKGVPNALIMRTIEKGNSFMKPQPVIHDTVQKYQAEALAAMEAEFDRCTRECFHE